MKLQVSIAVFAPFLLAIVFLSQSSAAAEPNWYPFVVARGSDRAAIQNIPMHQRPYRPMHFYGNAVRRAYHQGHPAPLARDTIRTAAGTLRLRR